MTDGREFHDGRQDGLVALESLDLDQVKSFSSLLRAMSKTAFSGRSLGEALDVTVAMVEDPDCKVVLTLSGAMTIAKMGKVISKMIDTGMVQAVVSTGALMAHGMSEAVGLTHYRHDPKMSDEELFDKGYNRVYDTLEMESNLNDVEAFTSKALDRLEGEPELSSEIVNRTLGQVLAEDPRSSGVLRSAYLKNVPVYVPAFTDSELGLDLSTWAMKKARARGVASPLDLFDHLPRFNPFLDLNSFARLALGREAPRDLHDRRRGAAQLGAGGRPVRRHHEPPPGRRPHAPALPVRGADLPRAGALGRPLGLHVLRGRLLGQVRAAVRGRPLRRGLRGRDHGLAAPHEGRPRGAGALVAPAASSRFMARLAEGLRRGEDGVVRCSWAGPDPIYTRYHDEEWGFPVADDRRLFEKLCLEGFQSGLSWLTILKKRESFRAAFRGFDLEAVARFGARDVARLLRDAGIVRHRGKIESTINNARRARELARGEGLARQRTSGPSSRAPRIGRSASPGRSSSPWRRHPPRPPSAGTSRSADGPSSARPPPTPSCRRWAS